MKIVPDHRLLRGKKSTAVEVISLNVQSTYLNTFACNYNVQHVISMLTELFSIYILIIYLLIYLFFEYLSSLLHQSTILD